MHYPDDYRRIGIEISMFLFGRPGKFLTVHGDRGNEVVVKDPSGDLAGLSGLLFQTVVNIIQGDKNLTGPVTGVIHQIIT